MTIGASCINRVAKVAVTYSLNDTVGPPSSTATVGAPGQRRQGSVGNVAIPPQC